MNHAVGHAGVGLEAHFLFERYLAMQHTAHHISELLQPVITAMGYELVGVELLGGRRALLRVYIDQPDGVSVDDCERVSHQVSGVLDVEDAVKGAYTLEVSSPGLDRPLFNASHFERFAGEQVRLKLYGPLAGRRNWRGELRGMRAGEVVLATEQGEVTVPLAQIETARLVPDFDHIGVGKGQPS